VIVLALGFPMLAMVLLSATGAFSPDLLSTLFIGGAVFTFAILAVFEIMRLVELDGHETGHAVGHAGASASGSHRQGVPDAAPRAEAAKAPAKPEPAVSDPVGPDPAPVASRSSTEIRASEPTPAPVANSSPAQPIRVEPTAPAIVIPEDTASRTAEAAPVAALPAADTAKPKPARKTGSKSQAKSGPKASVTKEAVSAKEAVPVPAKRAARAKSPRSKGPAKA
jgi:hypothetical protein